MDIETVNALLAASTSGDRPEVNLQNLLIAVRDQLLPQDKDPEVWVTQHQEAGPEAAFIRLKDGELEFEWKKEHAGAPGDEAGLTTAASKASYTVEIPQRPASPSGPQTYLAFSSQPSAPPPVLSAAAYVIAGTLLEVRKAKAESIIYKILNSYRDEMFRTSATVGQESLAKLATAIGSAFGFPDVWVLLYDFQNWRNLRKRPLVSAIGQTQERVGAFFYERLDNQIYEILRDTKPDTSSAITSSVQFPDLSPPYSDLRFFVTVAPLAYPASSTANAGIPYIAVVTIDDDRSRLNPQQRVLLGRFVLELQRVIRFKDELNHMKGLAKLLEEFLSLSTPVEVANSVVEYLSRTFDATEVAILERRGMFLCIIGQKHVRLKALPPLHIPTTEARVCEVARSRKERYDRDVHEEGSYLEVVSSTKTQFTVPLIWRGDVVGVLVFGLSVLDGLEPRHRTIIKAIAGYCAAAIAGSQRTAEERAVSHMLGEVLTGAALKINQVVESEENSEFYMKMLQSNYDLLEQCQRFINSFRKVQGGAGATEPIDLRQVVAGLKDDPLFADLLERAKDCAVEIRSCPSPLVVLAHKEGVQVALRNLIMNALEASPSDHCEINVSMDVQRQRPRASRRPIDFAVIKVTDNGRGISQMEQAKIFDLFYTTKTNHLGSGLNIAERLIQGFGGRIQLLSPAPDSDQGSEFSIWIPLSGREVKE